MPAPRRDSRDRAPPTAPPSSTPMASARAIEAALRRGGVDPAPALRQARITPTQLQNGTAWLSPVQMEDLTGAAMQALDDEGLGAFGRRLPWGSYGMLARASLTAADLGLALKRWCRHHGLLVQDLRLRLSVTADTAIVAIDEGDAHQALPALTREFSLVYLLRNIHGLACWYIDSRIPLQGVRLPFDAPAHAEAYIQMLPGPARFGMAQAELRFDARYLRLPLCRNEAALNLLLQRALPLTVLQYRRDRLLVEQVRHALATWPEAGHSAEALAAHLHLSARTLHRQLREEGASLQQLKDEVRGERARELLLRGNRPVKQVAAAVGFRNEKSFIRAFRGWTGQTPADFRAGGRA